MSTGRDNKITGQIGEYLVCAELGRRGLIATPFSGNVPTFDVLATDDLCRTVPIQVKSTNGHKWLTDARKWLKIELDEKTGIQKNLGKENIKHPDLIYVFVAIAPLPNKEVKDRFFILTESELQVTCIKSYEKWMDGHGWKRPRSPRSYDCRFEICDVIRYEDRWSLITDRWQKSKPDKSLEPASA